MITKNSETHLKSILKETKHAEHKLMNNDIIIKMRKVGFVRDNALISGCSTHLVFSKQQNTQNPNETRRRLKDANFCKHRFCATCNWRRNLNINKELLEAFTTIEADRSVSYLFLTLTIKNTSTEDLKATVKHLNQSFVRLSQTKAYKKAILGHFKALEIIGDKTPAGEIHPHFHIILIVNKSYFQSRNYLSQAKFTEMWQKALRVDYTPIVNVKRIKPKKNSNLTALQSAVFEVAKYSVKHTELTKKSDEEFVNIIEQTRRMRFFSTGGILKKKINLMKCDEELIRCKKDLEAQWVEIEEEIYKWYGGDFVLVERRKSEEHIKDIPKNDVAPPPLDDVDDVVPPPDDGFSDYQNSDEYFESIDLDIIDNECIP